MLKKQSDTLKFLCADMIELANSGHPGSALGLSDILVVLSKILKHNPKNPNFLNRDRLIFSGGHVSSLLYSFLYLSGYDISLDDLKNFRQLHSNTPGHPEISTKGVEIATGPLGQGVANAVGFAMAAKYANEIFKIFDHKIYCICGDGDLEEGISYEATSLAGHLGLNNLVIIYDSNKITIEGDTNLAFSEDVKKRFEAINFEVVCIDGHNFEEIKNALNKKSNKPLLIIANTTIANGTELAGSEKTHGSPLGKDVIKKAKKDCGFDENKEFFVGDDVLFEFRSAVEKGDLEEKIFNDKISKLPKEKQDLLNSMLNPDFSKIKYLEFDKDIATRDSNGQIMNEIAKYLPSFIGGSADLGPSNKTLIKNGGDFPNGVNIHFGIREHAMGAIINAFARYGLFLPYASTFFVFSDYLRPALRLSALMSLKNYFIFTHDSIGVGEDGPTHQPIEHLSSLRSIPNLYTFRPADGNENVRCWQKAFELNSPCAFVLSRQKLSILPKPIIGDVKNGGYLIKSSDNAKFTLLSSGSEVEICIKASEILENEGIGVNVVSVPCFELFCEQDESYLNSVIDKNTKILAIEASNSYEWYKFADEIYNINSFGESGNLKDVYEYFGYTPNKISSFIKKFLG